MSNLHVPVHVHVGVINAFQNISNIQFSSIFFLKVGMIFYLIPHTFFRGDPHRF